MPFINLALVRNVESLPPQIIHFNSEHTSKEHGHCLIKMRVHINKKGYHFVIYI